MSERPETPKTRPELLQKFAQDPITALQQNFSKGCVRAISFLQSLRAELAQSGTEIQNQNPDFAIFYKSPNTDALYWSSLTQMLKLGGFSKSEVQDAYMAFGENVSTKNGVTDEEAKKLLLSLADAAVIEVFDIKVTSESMGITEAISIIKDPVAYVKAMKKRNFTAGQAIADLRIVRRRISAYLQSTPGAKIDSVHGDFVKMHNSDDSGVAFYVSLFTILKAAGYSKDNVIEATMDPLTLPKKMQNMGIFIKLANEAIAEVYPN